MDLTSAVEGVPQESRQAVAAIATVLIAAFTAWWFRRNGDPGKGGEE